MSLPISYQFVDASSIPLVSIIIPCYNGAEFISEAIESALAQTHPRVEVIVVDDGSVDNSAEVIAHYPVRCLRGQRNGVSAARNRGVRKSKGAYIVFLDSDDRLLPNAISSGLTALTKHPECCMAIGTHNVVSSSGSYIYSRSKPLNHSDYYAKLLKSNFIECISSALFRRDIFRLVGWFNTKLHAAEDYDFYLRLARGHAICCHSDIVSDYRFHHTNVSHNSELMLTSTLRVVHAQYPYAFKTIKRCCCFSYGLWSWRRLYGRQLTRQLAALPIGDEAERSMKSWRKLAHTYPPGALFVLAIRALPGTTALTVLRQIGHTQASIDLGHSL